jgi:hypothetical protein
MLEFSRYRLIGERPVPLNSHLTGNTGIGKYVSVRVDIVLNRKSWPWGPFRESFREYGKVRHHNLLKPSDRAPEGTMDVNRAVQGQFDDIASRGRGEAKTWQIPQPGSDNSTFAQARFDGGMRISHRMRGCGPPSPGILSRTVVIR